MKIMSVMLIVLLLAGCSLVTTPTKKISIDRQEFINNYARVKILYWRAVDIVSRLCAENRMPVEECQKVAEIHREAKAIAIEIDVKIETPESEIDSSKVFRLMELALSLLL